MNEEVLFHEALTRAPSDRKAYLDQACAGDPALQAAVEALLRANVGASGYMACPAAGVAVDLPATAEAPGTRIGPYKLLEQIGEGGFGVVYLAEQQHPVRRKVALKVIKPGMDTREVIARFEAERQALALMEHPNIARVFDGGATATGRPYFVMELVRGVPITDFCDQHRLTPRQRLDLFVPVCQAVQHAHQKGIIHRDLKPSNVLVSVHDVTPVVKVIDFGVAKALGQELTDKTLFTAFAQMVGTPLYMSPEQAGQSGLDADTRSDVYSLGVLLYELLTGTTPFDKDRLRSAGFDEMRRILREEEPARPSTRLSTLGLAAETVSVNRGSEPRRLTALVRGELDWIVMKALEKDRARRYESASALARDVERYLADEPVEACPPSAAYRLRKFTRRNRGALATAGLIAVVLVGATAVSIRQAVRASRAEQEARLDRDKAVAEKQRGDEEAAIARAVDDFLQNDLLGQADIANQAAAGDRNRNIRVRELLDRAARGVESRFQGQKRTEAAIRLTLGRAYRALGEYPEAQKHLDRSLALRAETLGPRHPDTLESTDALALLAWFRGRHDEAEVLLNRVLEVRRADLGDDHADTLASKSYLATLWWQRGRPAEAEALQQEVLAARRARLGADHPNTLGTTNNLAMLYAGRGRFAEAERMFQHAVEGFRARYGADHPATFQGLSNLAALYSDWGRYDEADRQFRHLLDEARRVELGDDHPEALRYKSGLATVHLLRKRYADAEPLFRQLLADRRARLDAGHPDTLTTMNDLAVVCMETGRHDEAEPLFRDALKASRVRPGPRHPLTLKIANGLASLSALRARYDEAEVLFAEVLEARRATLSADHPETLMSVHNLGVCHRLRGQYDRAEPLLLEAVTGGRKRFGAAHPTTRQFTDNLVQLYVAWGKPAEADKWRKEMRPGDGKMESKDSSSDP